MMNVVGNRAFNPSTELSKPIRLALSKALAKKRKDRFDSCTAFVDALVGCGAVTAPSGKAFGKIAAVGLLVLGLAGGVWYWQGEKAKEETRIAAEQEEARRIAEEERAKNTRLAIEAFEAKRWEDGFRLSKNADLNNKIVQFYLGLMYERGYGVPKDDYEAVKWCRKSAEQGNADAQCNLGFMYENGRGVPKDETEAVKWYRKSAEQGNAFGQCNLGWMYESGRGVPKDDYEAVKWYRKSAEQGNVPAKDALKRLGY
ncbi:MAG: sel1 repeat family protein [Kiritimatiellae bacterium]|nr:sel1 repeat family protein [Kiritimatiellia bacterium]